MRLLVAVTSMVASVQAAPAQQQAHLLKSAHSLRCVFDSGWTAILQDSTRPWKMKAEQPMNPEQPTIIEQLDRKNGRARMIDPDRGGSDVTLVKQINQLSFVDVAPLGVGVTTVFDYYAPGTQPFEREVFAIQTTQGNVLPGTRSPFISTWYGHCRVLW
jgi:hypothetical protein